MYEKPVIKELNMQTCSESDACNNTEEKHSVHKAWYINFFFFFYDGQYFKKHEIHTIR